jgi:hypothetical protein
VRPNLIDNRRHRVKYSVRKCEPLETPESEVARRTGEPAREKMAENSIGNATRRQAQSAGGHFRSYYNGRLNEAGIRTTCRAQERLSFAFAE